MEMLDLLIRMELKMPLALPDPDLDIRRGPRVIQTLR